MPRAEAEWFKLAAGIREHEKSVRLASIMGDKRAWSWVVGLWCWCAEQQPDGRLTGPEAGGMVEFGAGWDGPAGQLRDNLVRAGFIDVERDPRGEAVLVIHGWSEMQSGLVALRAKESKRKAIYRANKRKAALAVQAGPLECPAGQSTGQPAGQGAGLTPGLSKDSKREEKEEADLDPRASAKKHPGSSPGRAPGHGERRGEPPEDGSPPPGVPESVAQPEEQRSPKPQAAGSTPARLASPAAPPAEQIPARAEVETTAPKPQASTSAQPTLDDDLPGRRLEVEDLSGEQQGPPPWQDAQDFRAKLERKVLVGGGRFNAALQPHEFAELDTCVKWAGGPEKAATWCSQRLFERKSGSKRVTQLRYFLAMLQAARNEEPAMSAEPVAVHPAAEVTDAAWGKVREYMRGHLAADVFARVVAPLKGAVNGAVRLESPDSFHAEFIRDQWSEQISEVVERVLKQKLAVVVTP